LNQQPSYRRFLHQKIDFGEQLIGIKGARGSGKTTVLLQHAHSSELTTGQILYVACDHLAMVDVSLFALAQTFYQEGGQLLLLDNTNLFYALCAAPNSGSLRESFFVSQLAHQHQVHYHDKSDFLVDDQWVFEIGGASKTLKQLASNPNGYAAVDDVVIGDGKRIPLWLFGMLY